MIIPLQMLKRWFADVSSASLDTLTPDCIVIYKVLNHCMQQTL